jgi:hypothetical protein
VSGKEIAALNAQCDSTHSPITAPAWMSSPPSVISQRLITVSKYE